MYVVVKFADGDMKVVIDSDSLESTWTNVDLGSAPATKVLDEMPEIETGKLLTWSHDGFLSTTLLKVSDIEIVAEKPVPEIDYSVFDRRIDRALKVLDQPGRGTQGTEKLKNSATNSWDTWGEGLIAARKVGGKTKIYILACEV